MSGSFSYLYWNANGLDSKIAEIRSVLFPPPDLSPSPSSNRFAALHTADDVAVKEESFSRPDLLGFVECKTDPDVAPSLPGWDGYTWFHFPQSRSSGGLAFLLREPASAKFRRDISFNVESAQFRCAPTGDAEYDSSTARNSAVAWLQVRPPNQPECLYGLLYLHPSADKEDWRQLQESLRAAALSELPLFLLGDFNTHSPLWGDPNSSVSRHEDALINLCAESCWDVLNTHFARGVITHPERRQGYSGAGRIIDLGVSSHSECVEQFRVLEDSGLSSDHFPLLLIVRHSPAAFVPSLEVPDAEGCARPSWNMHKADWQEFALLAARFLAESPALAAFQALQELPADSAPLEVLESAWSLFHTALLDAAQLSIPLRRPCAYSKSWWKYPHGDLPSAYRSFRHALRAAVARPSCLERRRQLAVCRRDWRSMQKKAQEWCHLELCASIQADPQKAINWKAWKRHSQRSSAADASALSSIPNPVDQSLPASRAESLNNLAVHFRSVTELPPIPAAVDEWGVAPMELDVWPAEEEKKEAEIAAEAALPLPPAAPDDPSDVSSNHRAVQEFVSREGPSIGSSPGDPALEALFKLEALVDHLDARKESSPGPDHIPILFLRQGGAAVQTALLALFNFSWEHGVLPLDWRSAHVLPLYKGKGERSQASNFRPISLTSCVVRTLESLIHDRLYPYAEQHHLLSPAQFGFRRDRSTQDAVFVLTEWIKELLCDPNTGAVPVAFLDLAKAYDKTWHDGLLFRLAKAGIKGRAWSWIAAFLKGRRFRTVAGKECSLWQSILASVPQGAVLSCLLFAIYIDPLAQLFAGEPFQLPLAHPDQSPDSQLFIPPKLPAIRIQLFADDIAVAPRALVDKLRFPPSFLLCGQPLERVEEYKYLGVWLDACFTWTRHFQHLLKAAQFAAFQCMRIIPRIRGAAAGEQSLTVGGPHFSAIRALVMGGVYSRATYGCMFLSGPSTESRMLALQSAIVRPLRQALALPKTAHILSILVECDCPTLPIYREQLLLSYARRLRLLGSPAHPAVQQLQNSRLNQQIAAAGGRLRKAWQEAGQRIPLLKEIDRCSQKWGSAVLPEPPAAVEANRSSSVNPLVFAESRQLSSAAPIPAVSAAPASGIVQRPPPSLLDVIFPSRAAAGASSSSGANPATTADSKSPPPLPSLSLLARRFTFKQWQQQDSGALLQRCKRQQGRSHYLYLEPRSSFILRSRLRFDRASLNSSLHQRNLAASPLCSFPACRNGKFVESVEHALLHCPRVTDARDKCRITLNRRLQRPLHSPLQLAELLGEVQPNKKAKGNPGAPAVATAAAQSLSSSSSSPSLPPRPVRRVFFPLSGLPRPTPSAPVPSARKAESLREARSILFITAALLRAVQATHAGVL